MSQTTPEPVPPTGAFAYDALMEITSRPDVVFVEGHGSWLRDHTGKEYLDFVQGWAVNCLGHCPPAIANALRRQAATLINCSPAFYNAPMIALAGLIVRHSGLDKVFFTNCGAEANEGAIKLARKWGALHRGGAFEIVTMTHAFHGRTLATMSASDKAPWKNLFEPKVAGFPKAEMNDIAGVERLITEKTVGVMLEPIQGESGVIPASLDFLKEVRALTKRKGLLMILDEVQTGIGRTGTMFAYEQAGIAPDILTLAKGLGGGVPIGALVAAEEVCCFAHGDQGGTFNGNALMTAVGLAIMEEVGRPEFLESVRKTGAYLAEQLRRLSRKHGLAEVRGQGLLLALDLGAEVAADVAAKCFARGLLLNAPRPRLLRFMPALNVTREEVDTMIEVLDGVLGEK
jgi:acetylornithine/N-succinyldiaminopimelate aminotransferase